MSRKIYAATFALTLTIAVAVSVNMWGRTHAEPASSASATELLNMLPASDAVAFIDVQRTLSEVVPNIFVNDSATLARVNQTIDKLKDRTGADARQFDAIAVGMRFRKGGGTPEPEVVTGVIRGRFNSSELIANGLAKAKAEGKAQPREEQYEGSTIYNVEGDLSRGLRLAVMDSNTVIFGDAAGVRATLDVRAGRAGAGRVDSSLVELATLNANAVAGFAANIPAEAAQKMSNDELGQMFASVRQVYGSASATGTTGEVNVTLRTETGEQAQAVAAKLNIMRQLVSAAMRQGGTQTGAVLTAQDDKQAMQARRGPLPFPVQWLKDVEIRAEGSDIKLRLEEPLAELAPFLSTF